MVYLVREQPIISLLYKSGRQIVLILNVMWVISCYVLLNSLSLSLAIRTFMDSNSKNERWGVEGNYEWVWSWLSCSQESILLRPYTAFDAEITSAYTVSWWHHYNIIGSVASPPKYCSSRTHPWLHLPSTNMCISVYWRSWSSCSHS